MSVLSHLVAGVILSRGCMIVSGHGNNANMIHS